MPIHIQHIKDNYAVLQTYIEPLTSADFSNLKNQMDREILPKSEHVIHIVADFQHITSLPTSMLTSGINLMNRAHPNTGIVICVTRNEFVKAMARIFSGVLSKRRFKVVASLESAYEEVDMLIAEKS